MADIQDIYDASPTEREAAVFQVGRSGVQLASVTTPGAAVANVLSEALTGLSGFKRLELLLNVTAAATAAGDLLDVFVDSSPDGGTTWVNIVHFTQVLGNGGAKKFVAIVDEGVTDEFDATSDLAAGATPRPFIGDRLRVRHTVVDAGADANAVFTFTVTGAFK